MFTEDLIATWVDWQRTNEVDRIRLRFHLHEFELFYDLCRRLTSAPADL